MEASAAWFPAAVAVSATCKAESMRCNLQRREINDSKAFLRDFASLSSETVFITSLRT